MQIGSDTCKALCHIEQELPPSVLTYTARYVVKCIVIPRSLVLVDESK